MMETEMYTPVGGSTESDFDELYDEMGNLKKNTLAPPNKFKILFNGIVIIPVVSGFVLLATTAAVNHFVTGDTNISFVVGVCIGALTASFTLWRTLVAMAKAPWFG
jgi:hypothetical protein